MFGFIDTIFSSDKTTSKITDAVINTGDKLWYTDEEKADMKMRYVEYLPTLLKSYEPFRIAQRVLAIWFSFLFGLSFLVGLSMFVFNAIIKYNALKDGIPIDKIILIDMQPLYNLIGAFSIGLIMSAIIMFYFGAGAIESFKRKSNV